MKHPYIFYTFLFSLLALSAHAQTIEDAKAWYQEGRYAEALPVFQAEYANTPNNAALNQWLGASLYETGRWMEAQKHLLFASQKNIPESYLYLGNLYAKTYRFADAEKEFEKYQRANRRNNAALDKLAQSREYADRLKRTAHRAEDIQIIDSAVVLKSDFLAAYNLSAPSGSLMPMSEFFKNPSSGDKTLYMNERKDKIYYSQGDPIIGFDLFTMEKLLDSFGNEKKLPESINAGGSQSFPFVMPDGVTVYFASTGHESLGGYDLFVTRYNLASDSYLTPNRLNAPFNSPFNDYMMAIDEEKGIGWFASDRFQPMDSVCVYTFIPNPQVTLLETDDEKIVANRARISAIADTWKENADYADLRAKAHQKAVLQQQSTGDFVFVVNDQATYRTLSDFKNGQARSLFSQAITTENQLNTLEKELSAKREQFSSGGSSNQMLRASILDLEKQTETLFREIDRLKMQARNEEIRQLYPH